DAEHALATLDEVDDLVGRRAGEDRGAVAHERDLGEVFDALPLQVADCDADLLERDARIQQALDDLDDQDVAEAVEALRPGAGRGPDRGDDELGAGPVIELTVGDADDAADGRSAIAGLVVESRDVIVEEEALRVTRQRLHRHRFLFRAVHTDSSFSPQGEAGAQAAVSWCSRFYTSRGSRRGCGHITKVWGATARVTHVGCNDSACRRYRRNRTRSGSSPHPPFADRPCASPS